MRVSVGFRRSLSEKLSREDKPSFIPEVLDLVAGVALIAVVKLVRGGVVSEAYLLPTWL
jgi:hypothetical protein